jgi:hypothetical protein
MTLKKFHALLLQFEAESMEGGFSPEESVRLFLWWMESPRENCFVSGGFLVGPEGLHPPLQ